MKKKNLHQQVKYKQKKILKLSFYHLIMKKYQENKKELREKNGYWSAAAVTLSSLREVKRKKERKKRLKRDSHRDVRGLYENHQ